MVCDVCCEVVVVDGWMMFLELLLSMDWFSFSVIVWEKVVLFDEVLGEIFVLVEIFVVLYDIVFFEK